MNTRRESVRTELAQAALRALQAKSWDEVGTREVAAEAGVSLGRLHYYFESKEALILAATQLFYDELLEQFFALVNEKTPEEIVKGLLAGAHFDLGSPESEGRVRMHVEARIRSLREQSIAPIIIRYRLALRQVTVDAFQSAGLNEERATALAIIVLDFLESFTPHRIQEGKAIDAFAVEDLFLRMVKRELESGDRRRNSKVTE